MSEIPDLLAEAEHVAEIAAQHEVQLIVIGALALAAYQYVRATEDVDMAGVVSLAKLRVLASVLKEAGYEVDLREPEALDPLGGVLDVRTRSGLVQIISFAERFPAVIQDAMREAHLVVRENSSLPIVPLPHLVVLKLYAGGLKSKADVAELLTRNPDADLQKIESLCTRYRIRGFSDIRDELGG
jgi:hypothetical protein